MLLKRNSCSWDTVYVCYDPDGLFWLNLYVCTSKVRHSGTNNFAKLLQIGLILQFLSAKGNSNLLSMPKYFFIYRCSEICTTTIHQSSSGGKSTQNLPNWLPTILSLTEFITYYLLFVRTRLIWSLEWEMRIWREFDDLSILSASYADFEN